MYNFTRFASPAARCPPMRTGLQLAQFVFDPAADVGLHPSTRSVQKNIVATNIFTFWQPATNSSPANKIFCNPQPNRRTGFHFTT